MIEKVEQEIIDAFSWLEVPKRENLLSPSTDDWEEERQEIANKLLGKSWLSLEQEFLVEEWAAFCYLSAEGYRYYLPSLLTKCLANFSEDNDLIHSTVYSLNLSFHSLYYYGKDEDFEYQTSLFTSEQYKAVCSFLGLVFDTLPELKFLSAQALRWGWNQQTHPAQAKSKEFYQSLHNYQYPLSKDPQVRELQQQINAAFAKTPYPGDNNLCGSDLGDEPAEYAMEFRGLNWKTLHPYFLAKNSSALSFLTDEGFRYFLSAFLIADLIIPEIEGAWSNTDPVFHLTHGLVEEEFENEDNFNWYEIATRKFSHFNQDERKAIVSYLKYCSIKDEYSRERINEALENYWIKTL